MKVIVAGDFCDRDRTSNLIRNKSYELLFDEIKPIIRESDVSIVNFEFPIEQGNGAPISKNGPSLKGQVESVDAIKYAGFTVATLANNHILDQGADCAVSTHVALNNAGIQTVGLGGGKLPPRDSILYVAKANETLAIINCSEHEFSVTTEDTVGANPLNPIIQYYQIREARKKADYVLVIVHGGHEHFQLPSPRMKETYRFFVDAGADAVVNHHQHCYSGYEYYNGKPIVYGLGNFLFDWLGETRQTWFEGYFAEIDFKSQCISLTIKPYIQCKEYPNIRLMNEEETIQFQKSISALNEIISDDEKLSTAINQYYEKSSWGELFSVEPYRGKIFKKLAYWGILPKMMNTAKRLGLINHIDCESHRDKLLFALKKSIK